MDTQTATPKTLLDALRYFQDPDVCLNFMRDLRWPNGVVTCPRCGSSDVIFLAKAQVWKCRVGHRSEKFSIRVGTVLEDSPIGLDKWLAAFWMIANCKNGVSSYEIHRALGITQKSAWFLMHRIRKAMRAGTLEKKMGGEVEVDETFIGGKARNMHIAQRRRRITGTGTKDKVAVMGILERDGQIRTVVVEDRKKRTLQAEVKRHVEAGSALYSDELKSYDGLEGDYAHKVINHAVAYADGQVQPMDSKTFGVS